MCLPSRLGLILLIILSLMGSALAGDSTRYLAFQIFTGSYDSAQLRRALPPPPEDLRQAVTGLARPDRRHRKERSPVGFILGPVAFDNTDDDVRKLISAGFDIALDTGVAVGFHIDDSMFWSRLKILNARDSIEWLDWKGELNTGQRLDWSLTPIKIMPQLCFNSKAVREAVSARAALIGSEVAKGLERLRAARKPDLFVGVIAGWETRIGRDFDTGKYLGYCALTNAGYGPTNPPPNPEAALGEITKDFIGFWAQSLIAAGVPEGKIFSHIAFQSSAMNDFVKAANSGKDTGPSLRAMNYTPPGVAFATDVCRAFPLIRSPGFCSNGGMRSIRTAIRPGRRPRAQPPIRERPSDPARAMEWKAISGICSTRGRSW